MGADSVIQPRDYQIECVDAAFDYLATNAGNPLLALPTGTGKSLVIAMIIKRAFSMLQGVRVLMLTHIETLISQNAERLLELWPTAPVGIYCAGLKQRCTINPIVYGSVASVKNCVHEFGKRNIIIIDEAHLLSPNDASMYQYVIAELRKINPFLVVIGLTATKYRLRQGLLTAGGLFNDIAYDLTDIPGFSRLVNAGFMCPLIGRPMETQFDLSEVAIVGDEYVENQLQKAVDKYEVTYKAIKETLEWSADRKSWLAFGAGVEHSEHIATMFQSFGVDMLALHSKLPKKEQRARYAAFKAGEIRGLTSANMLTTGIDHAPIDLIIDLQPTLSPNKHVQKYGRGTRPFETKPNCLVLDFARNTSNNGPINNPRIPEPPSGKKKKSTPPIRICPEDKKDASGKRGCGFYNHARAVLCEVCGFEFPTEVNLQTNAYTGPVMLTDSDATEQTLPEYVWHEVNQIFYQRYEKRGSPPSMKVTYACGLRSFNEWLGFEQSGIILHKAREWWRQRTALPVPLTTADAMKNFSAFRVPTKIKVWVNKKYPEIIDYEY